MYEMTGVGVITNEWRQQWLGGDQTNKPHQANMAPQPNFKKKASAAKDDDDGIMVTEVR